MRAEIFEPLPVPLVSLPYPAGPFDGTGQKNEAGCPAPIYHAFLLTARGYIFQP